MKLSSPRMLGVIAAVLALLTAAIVWIVTSSTSGGCNGNIATLSALEGTDSISGVGIRDATQLAVGQFLAHNPQCRVQVVVKDLPESSPNTAKILSGQIVQDPTILGLVGPEESGDAGVVAPILSAAGVPIISSSAAADTLTQQGWKTFHRDIGNNAEQGPAAGRYIKNILRTHKLFTVNETNSYGESLVREVNTVMASVGNLTIPAGQTGFSADVSRITATGADTVFYGGYPQEASPLLHQLRAAGFLGAFVGAGGLYDPTFPALAGADANGAVALCPCSPPSKVGGTFFKDYQTKFGMVPPPFSPEAFDAANIFLAGIKAGNSTRASMESFVNAYQGQGITGKLKFTPAGDLDPDLVTTWSYKIEDGQFIPDQRMYSGLPSQ